MRQIEKEAVAAFFAGKAYRNKNTEVRPLETHVEFLLHGNRIAWRRHEDNPDGSPVLRLSLACWPTMTTRSRLNAILSGLFARHGLPRNRLGVPFRFAYVQRDHETLIEAWAGQLRVRLEVSVGGVLRIEDITEDLSTLFDEALA